MIDICIALDQSISPHTGVRTIQNPGVFWQAVFQPPRPYLLLPFSWNTALHPHKTASYTGYNHRGLTFNTHDKSAVVMLAVVVVFALACFATNLRCSFLHDQLSGNRRHPHLLCKSDFKFRIPMLVLKSAINPLAYAFFKRDIKKALKGKKTLPYEVGRIKFMNN